MGIFDRFLGRDSKGDDDKARTKAVFLDCLKTRWSPLLRETGFKGSGRRFRRIQGPWAHCITVQSKSDGSSCGVNLGAEPRLQAIRGFSELPDFAKIKEIECEVRDRLRPDDAMSDWWWTYGSNEEEALRSATSLIDTWTARGERFFAAYREFPGPAANVTVADFVAGRASFFRTTKIRAVLLYARIFLEVKDFQRAIEFAEHGIATCGGGWMELTFKDILQRCGKVRARFTVEPACACYC